ncbi:hypothetical protein BDY24DRAFT_382661 [Mrakia frigida]|uniref:uncharacterized protein n=1 Tax=Mrakia frigida TaxID=29902 RepID=UPI003FCBFC0E
MFCIFSSRRSLLLNSLSPSSTLNIVRSSPSLRRPEDSSTDDCISTISSRHQDLRHDVSTSRNSVKRLSTSLDSTAASFLPHPPLPLPRSPPPRSHLDLSLSLYCVSPTEYSRKPLPFSSQQRLDSSSRPPSSLALVLFDLFDLPHGFCVAKFDVALSALWFICLAIHEHLSVLFTTCGDECIG